MLIMSTAPSTVLRIFLTPFLTSTEKRSILHEPIYGAYTSSSPGSLQKRMLQRMEHTVRSYHSILSDHARGSD